MGLDPLIKPSFAANELGIDPRPFFINILIVK